MLRPTVLCLTHRRPRVVINCITVTMGKSLEIWNQQYVFYPLFVSSSYGYSSNEVSYSSPYGYSASVTPQQTMAYDISADYVDSTTYEPRSTMMDPEFISHGSINTRTLTVHFIYTQTSL